MHASPARRFASTCAAACACLVLVGLFALQLRYLGIEAGIVPVARAEAADLATPAAAPNGSAVTVDYCSEVVAANEPSNPTGRTQTQLAFDDAWLLRDSATYQHDLATACAVLAAVCNSESQYYDGAPGSIPYAEQALGRLGFGNVRTESYALRSSIIDEMGALLTGSSDVAAYTLASKTIAASEPDGTPLTLLFVGIRGTYGSEWLSNFNFLGQDADDPDHRGFKAAEEEVKEALRAYAHEIGADPACTRILITGHSRGGAIANLLAADLDQASGGDKVENNGGNDAALAPSSGIYAYTFAAPCPTLAADRHDDAYGNIFNIVNEADIVPQLPLAAWGFGRYGTTVTLPSATTATGVQRAYERNTGHALGSDEGTLAALCSWGSSASEHVPSADDLVSPLGVIGAVQAFAGLDLSAVLNAHYPDTYIAWMQSGELARVAA